MKLTVIGFLSPRTEQALINARAAAGEFEERPRVYSINDLEGIARMGRVSTPTVLVNGKLKSSGHIPSVYEITTWIEEELKELVV